MKKSFTRNWLTLVCLWLSGCVGTDLINDSTTSIPARIVIDPSSAAVQTGNTVAFQATFYDTIGGIVPGTVFQWTSLNPAVASIDENGVAAGNQPSQAMIMASVAETTSEPALLTVVADPNQVARVVVTPDSGQLRIGESLQFTAAALNLNGGVLVGKTFTWRSSDSNIANIANGGLATANASGAITIVATTDGIDSVPAHLQVLGQSRTGTFT